MAVIYRHLKPDGTVFYIGIGKKDKRAYDKNGRNPHWKRTVAKYGYEVQILKRDLTWIEAGELEKILVAHYGRMDLGLGNLVNLTDGGEYGTLGRIMSEEQKNNLKIASKKYLTGRVLPEEHKKNMSLAKLRVPRPKGSVEKSVATRASKNLKLVNFICTETLRTWGTIEKCAEDIGVSCNTLASYLNLKRHARNITTIMKYEDYLNYGIIPPYTGTNKIEVINTLTKKVFKSIGEAARSIDMLPQALNAKLNSKRPNNTPFMLLTEYEEKYGKIEQPLLKN